MAQHSSALSPSIVTGKAGDQPGSIPVLADPPTASELPTDDSGEPVGLIYLDQGTGIVKVTVPDGSGGVATGNVVDLSASISLGTGDTTGLL